MVSKINRGNDSRLNHLRTFRGIPVILTMKSWSFGETLSSVTLIPNWSDGCEEWFRFEVRLNDGSLIGLRIIKFGRSSGNSISLMISCWLKSLVKINVLAFAIYSVRWSRITNRCYQKAKVIFLQTIVKDIWRKTHVDSVNFSLFGFLEKNIKLTGILIN